MRKPLFVVLAGLALFGAACVDAGTSVPTVVFPTEVPTAAPETATPRVTGACTLLTAADIQEVLGVAAAQASSSPLSCGYAHGSETIALTLLSEFVWENYERSFAAADTPQTLSVGQQSLYFPATLGGLVMTQQDRDVYLLSGIPTAEAATELMSRIVERNTSTEGS